jgi:secreted PhoX family phosphatase
MGFSRDRMAQSEHFADIAQRFLSRRALLQGAAAAAALSATPLGALLAVPARAAAATLNFEELGRIGKDEPVHHVAPGYRADVLLAWGDPILPGAPAFEPMVQTAAKQLTQFGFNCDFIGYLPLKDGEASKAEHLASGDSTHGLLCVNHEYSSARYMFPGMPDSDAVTEKSTAESCAIERASLGHSVVEIRKTDGAWSVVKDSPYARRLHADSDFALSGPARGHARMKTDADPDGVLVKGTLANCAGGVTPWGTILSAEENIQNYFTGVSATLPTEFAREAASADSFAVSPRAAMWSKFDARFDINKTPHEFNRFGWIVEIDPYDPASMPKKRTALGRFRHEAATIVARDGQPVVAYMGDDQTLQYVYKFVSSRAYVAADPAANADILDEGTLSTARFADDGTGEWLPLVHGQGPLTSENGFNDQGDVVIDARRAAKLLGATETDRPEDVETDPITSRTYIAFTGGTDRKEKGPVSPRAPNMRGHILEILAPGADGDRDHLSPTFNWDILLLAGHPEAEINAQGKYGPGLSDAGYFAQPDNLVFDPKGRLWIATDGADEIGLADGLWACCVTGPERATTRHFFSVPMGGEMTGPCFTPDGETLFVSIQHPGQGGDASFDAPSIRWPAPADSTMPPRPSVVVITREGGGPIGG